MVPIWLYQIPTFWLGFLIIGSFVLIAVVGLWLTRPLAKRLSRSENDFTNYYIAVIAVVYAVLIGLIAAASWENYTDVEALVSAEATSVSNLYRDVEIYPPELRDQLRGMLRQYVHHVITEEWPAQRRGIVPRTHTAMVQRVVQGWAAFEPTTPGQQIAHAECLRQLDDLLSNRRKRLDSVDSNLPDLMWLVVFLGAILAIAMTFLFWTESQAFHLFLNIGLAVTLGLVIFLIVSLDRPLVGSVSVPPTSFQELEDVMGPV